MDRDFVILVVIVGTLAYLAAGLAVAWLLTGSLPALPGEARVAGQWRRVALWPWTVLCYGVWLVFERAAGPEERRSAMRTVVYTREELDQILEAVPETHGILFAAR